MAGSRWFDIRPGYIDGYYTRQHHSPTDAKICGYVGANGESIDTIISDINTFLDGGNSELVILRLSQALDERPCSSGSLTSVSLQISGMVFWTASYQIYTTYTTCHRGGPNGPPMDS